MRIMIRSLIIATLFISSSAMAEYKKLYCDGQEAHTFAAQAYNARNLNITGSLASWATAQYVVYGKEESGFASMNTYYGNAAALFEPNYKGLRTKLRVFSYPEVSVSVCLYSFTKRNPDGDDLKLEKAVSTYNGSKRSNFTIPAQSWSNWSKGIHRASLIEIKMDPKKMSHLNGKRMVLVAFVSKKTWWSRVDVRVESRTW